MRYYVEGGNADYFTARDALYAAHVMAKARREPFKVYSMDKDDNLTHIATVIPGEIEI